MCVGYDDGSADDLYRQRLYFSSIKGCKQSQTLHVTKLYCIYANWVNFMYRRRGYWILYGVKICIILVYIPIVCLYVWQNIKNIYTAIIPKAKTGILFDVL